MNMTPRYYLHFTAHIRTMHTCTGIVQQPLRVCPFASRTHVISLKLIHFFLNEQSSVRRSTNRVSIGLARPSI